MSLNIHSYTVKLCTQELNTKPSARDFPYIYKAVSIVQTDLKELTQDTLDKPHREAADIITIIEDETFRRLNTTNKGE